MNATREEKIYQTILRSVMWGTERDDILYTLQVNGITGEQAEEIYQSACRERIAFLRSEALRKAILGLMLLIAAIGLFSVFWFGFGAITRFLFIICAGLAAWGIYLLVDGTVAAVFAPSKKGSVTPDSA